jgi:hypothetical protein
MATPESGPGKKKFYNDDVLRCFDEEHRRRVGKIELSASEVTDILNNRVLSESKSVTRQAVSKRLDELVETGDLVRNEHGRSHLYARQTDIDDLFAPAAGGGGQITQQKETSGLFSGSSTGQRRSMELPGVFVVMLLGAVGWFTVKSCIEWAFDTDSDAIGAAWLGLTTSLFVATVGYIVLSVYVTFTGVQAGLPLQVASAGTGLLILAVVIYKWGMVGASAKASEAVIKRLSGETA